MDFGVTTYGLGLLAGVLSTLSPCVLPLIPILLGTALGSHKHGPLALAVGLMVSFAFLGTAIAYLGTFAGMDPALVRNTGALILGFFGVILLSERLQQRFAYSASGLSTSSGNLLARLRLDGLTGQFVVGLVLGVVWSPCVGPTLGAAIALASQGSHLPQIALLMGLFGLGAGLPLALLGLLSRATIMRVRGRLMRAGKIGKIFLGATLLLLAAAILTGADKHFETWVVEHSPDWLTELTTRY